MGRKVKWHYLKTWPEEFKKLLSGMKTFEIRKNDRDFQLCDYLVLEEWNPETEKYTRRCLTRVITSKLIGKFGLSENLIVLSIDKA